MLFDNILKTIGNTPSIKLNNININNTNLYVKAEFFNPASSVKDRLAISIIENAEKEDLLNKGQTIVEVTSGNTGIGLAMVCAAKNYPLIVTMPDSASIERRKLMRFLGAKVLLTPASEGGTGAYKKAKELVDKNNWFFARQFENKDNANIHESTTGIEIYNDFKDIGLDYWISGYGTGGTFTGVSRVLRSKMPKTKLIITEPDAAQLIGSNNHQLRNKDGSAAESHPDWNPHPIQGWTTDFIPLVLQESIDNNYFDELLPVSGDQGIYWANKLAKKEGIITGVSGGSTFAIATEIAKKAPEGSNILCMLPDSAERYMSSILFDHIEEEMNTDETSIYNSV
ncbi:MAG: PLP-dependent cysteine synthase family protein [Gammaproteobacteria bacterium]|tara:strand:- start:5350 stop:6372 length:1023 start_codon:yes stop_codon:yes gene_type:complete